jgi:hypothetical protein
VLLDQRAREGERTALSGRPRPPRKHGIATGLVRDFVSARAPVSVQSMFDRFERGYFEEYGDA